MSVATITQAQYKGLRHQFAGIASDLLEFCRKLYAAHGGGAMSAARGGKQANSARLATLADRFEQYSPGLSAEIRNLALRA
jgi:hypothetical protein